MPDDVTPPGWAFNPSSWKQRLPLILWGLAGFLIAGYLSLYQWRVIEDVWEPFFGDGSRRILNSPLSHLFPIPDAALGALGYLFDAVAGAVGGRHRWRTMPWMVLLFGLAVGPLGVVSVILVVLQPVLFDAWCTLCLASAVVSVAMISPSLDEALACLQYLKREKARGRFWKAFWGRGSMEKAAPVPSIAGRIRGAAWIQLAVALLGLWFMASPDVLGETGRLRDNWHILGPLVATFAVMALWEFMGVVRWVNAGLGLWLAASSVVWGGSMPSILTGAACGSLVFLLSLPRGSYRSERFGGGWSALFKTEGSLPAAAPVR